MRQKDLRSPDRRLAWLGGRRHRGGSCQRRRRTVIVLPSIVTHAFYRWLPLDSLKTRPAITPGTTAWPKLIAATTSPPQSRITTRNHGLTEGYRKGSSWVFAWRGPGRGLPAEAGRDSDGDEFLVQKRARLAEFRRDVLHTRPQRGAAGRGMHKNRGVAVEFFRFSAASIGLKSSGPTPGSWRFCFEGARSPLPSPNCHA